MHPGCALIPLNKPHLSPPLLYAVRKMGTDCCCSFSEQKWSCFYHELGRNGMHFIFYIFFPVGMQEVGFFFVFVFLSDKEVVRGRRRLLLRYPLLFNFPFFHVHFMAVTTAVEGLNVVEPHCTLQGGSSLTLQSFHFFLPPYSCL